MAGCLPCFIIPLLLFIFHRFIQPIILKFWNPWEKKVDKRSYEEIKEECPCKADGTCDLKAKIEGGDNAKIKTT